MSAEPDYDAEMRLPEGKTCDDCTHAKRCFGFGFSSPGRTSCDFWPNQFRAPPATPDAAVLAANGGLTPREARDEQPSNSQAVMPLTAQAET